MGTTRILKLEKEVLVLKTLFLCHRHFCDQRRESSRDPELSLLISLQVHPSSLHSIILILHKRSLGTSELKVASQTITIRNWYYDPNTFFDMNEENLLD